ncbi:outer membrane beta-barrel protein [Hyphomicrobium sp. D-2]|uniref:outer membrane beta-barrel protein n=1 Tax=Hyphomicrobium sp. D-2 TaxID=3041621 RepID=UPI0024546261|nr:outer membrane beta-barrel protein [Hyphomicrobium sp. D-2]MDH4983857.1 outer membrane beta-barrel protein [Hyphomicrobium sp. D-2]
MAPRRVARWIAFTLAACSTAAHAGEISAQASGIYADWSGLYVGAHFGGALALTKIDDPFGPSIYGDTVRTMGQIGGGQVGYNWQFGRTVLGVEAEASWANAYGTDTCFAFSGNYISANCGVDINAMGSFTGRAGWLIDNDGRTLLYGKAGLAWQNASVTSATSGGTALPSTSTTDYLWGLALGVGAERMLGERWSVRAEYDYRHFSDGGMQTPVGIFQPVPSPDPNAVVQVPSRAADFSQQTHLIKFGLNYRFGEAQQQTRSVAAPAFSPPGIPGVRIEIGARYVYGWGRFQKDLGDVLGVSSPASRLTYGGMKTNGAELLGRVDLANGIVAKGFIGWGDGTGSLYDEDWAIPVAVFAPYSNTWSKVDDRISYGTVDVGYNVWRDDGSRVTPFVGYGHFHQQMAARGCVQVANPQAVCRNPFPLSILGITEDDTWQVLRVGVAADMEILPAVTLSLDAAYLPFVRFNGTDNHVRRSLISPEWGGGTGTQIDLMLNYAVTEQFSVGVGGRYWSMWARDGRANFGGGGDIVPIRHAVEQAAFLAQGSYAFDWSGPSTLD